MTRIDRREAIKQVVALLGGALGATSFNSVVAAVANGLSEYQPRVLDDGQFSLLARICDLAIPETDTPGALEARVPQFIDLMLSEWAAEETRQHYRDGIGLIDKFALEQVFAPFLECSEGQQTDLLLVLDGDNDTGEPAFSFFRELKKLVLYGYYTSEPGATIELHYQRVPGSYQGCVPLEEGDRDWATTGWRYEL